MSIRYFFVLFVSLFFGLGWEIGNSGGLDGKGMNRKGSSHYWIIGIILALLDEGEPVVVIRYRESKSDWQHIYMESDHFRRIAQKSDISYE